MNYLILLLLGILAALLQSSLLSPLLPPGFVPDILLLLVLYGSLLFPWGKGLLLCFALGLLSDLFSGAPDGMNALFAITLFVMSKAIQARVFMRGFRAIWGLAVLAFALKIPYYALLSVLFRLRFPTPTDALLIWVGEFVSSMFLMPVVFYIVSKALGVQDGWYLQQQKSSPA